LASPVTLPAASFTAPLACSAEPLIRSLSIFHLSLFGIETSAGDTSWPVSSAGVPRQAPSRGRLMTPASTVGPLIGCCLYRIDHTYGVPAPSDQITPLGKAGSSADCAPSRALA
jgi:hypothetical protein